MIQFSLLGSGSSGNALLIKTERTKILVDCGLSFRQLRLRAAEVGETIGDLAAVLITHEHSDHVNGLGVLTRRLNRDRETKVPVYMTQGTHLRLPASLALIDGVEIFDAGDTITIGDLEAASFSVVHDAADPVSYVLRSNGAALGIAADLGHATALVKQRLTGVHALIIESNYCPDMLQTSSYPIQVRQRINGRTGHLSNADMASLLAHVAHDALQRVVLIHISDENNTHELAKQRATQALGAFQIPVDVALQDRPTALFQVQL